MRSPRWDWTPPYVGTERRRTPRYSVKLPVEFSAGSGTTLDVSEAGVRFESLHRFAHGDSITLQLMFRHLGGDHTEIVVAGEVVRVEEYGETFLVAVHVDDMHLG